MRHACYILFVIGSFLSTAGYGQVGAPDVTDAHRIYQIIAGAPLANRHVIFRNLSPELKSAVWTIHLSQFLDDPRLSQPQRQLVQVAITLLVPLAYEKSADPSLDDVSEPLTRLEQSVRNLFPPDLAASVFGMLGPPPKSDETSAPVLPRTLSPIGTDRRIAIPLGGAVPDCECSRVSDLCLWDTTCMGSPCYVVSGCGFGWKYQCTSMCVNPNQ
jgi:hypothetical protein